MILDGKAVAKEWEEKIKNEVEELQKKTHKVPKLATVIVGDDMASQTYVRMKENACKRVGMDSCHFAFPNDAKEEDVIKKIKELNDDDTIDGILLQHPVPRHINERNCFDTIGIDKDVDGVNTASFGAFAMGKEAFKSATPYGIIRLLDHYQIDVSGKDVVVIGRSPILGKPVAALLLNKNATITITHTKTKNLEEIVKRADVIVACVGKAEFVKKEWVKEGAVIVDAGYNAGNVGDVEKLAYEKASSYTPVPGGVGPMTINTLLLQTLEAFKKRRL